MGTGKGTTKGTALSPSVSGAVANDATLESASHKASIGSSSKKTLKSKEKNAAGCESQKVNELSTKNSKKEKSKGEKSTVRKKSDSVGSLTQSNKKAKKAPVESEDFYEVLGVERTSSEEEIRTAYLTLAKEYHPDKNTSDEAKGAFQRVSNAYFILGDTDRRAQFDSGENSEESLSFEAAYELVRSQFPELSTKDIADFGSSYKNSIAEREDIAKHITKYSGDMTNLVDYLPMSTKGDVSRLKKIVEEITSVDGELSTMSGKIRWQSISSKSSVKNSATPDKSTTTKSSITQTKKNTSPKSVSPTLQRGSLSAALRSSKASDASKNDLVVSDGENETTNKTTTKDASASRSSTKSAETRKTSLKASKVAKATN